MATFSYSCAHSVNTRDCLAAEAELTRARNGLRQNQYAACCSRGGQSCGTTFEIREKYRG